MFRHGAWRGPGSAAMASLSICVSGIALAGLTGCVYALVTEIDDLRLESIEHVAVTEIKNEQSEQTYLQVVDDGELLQVKLSTREGLTEIIDRRGLPLAHVDLFFCDETVADREISAHGSLVYAGDGKLQIVEGAENDVDKPRAKDGRYLYSLLVDRPAPIYKAEYVNGQRVQIGTVDIEDPPKPICLQIYAREMIFGKVVRTNVVALQSWDEVMGQTGE